MTHHYHFVLFKCFPRRSQHKLKPTHNNSSHALTCSALVYPLGKKLPAAANIIQCFGIILNLDYYYTLCDQRGRVVILELTTSIIKFEFVTYSCFPYIFFNLQVDADAKRIAEDNYKTYTSLIKHLVGKCTSDIEKARAIFR